MKGERTLAVILFCLFQAVFLGLGLVFQVQDTRAFNAYTLYILGALLVTAALTYGLWRMRRWAMYGYVAFFALNQGVLCGFGIWHWTSLFMPAVFAVIWFTSFRFTA